MQKRKKNKVKTKRSGRTLSKSASVKNKRKMKKTYKERALSSFKPEDQKDILAVQAVKAGNDNAYSRIMDRYRGYLEQRFFNKVKDREVARDLASDVLMKVLVKVREGAYRPTHTFNAWFYMLADRHLIDWSRKSEWKFRASSSSIDNLRSDSEGSESSFSESLADPDMASDTNCLNEERLKAIREGLATLDELGRTIIGMFYGKDMSYDEMAEELNMNVNTMKVNLMRAKRLLAEYIAREYPEFAMEPKAAMELAGVDSETRNVDGEDFKFYFQR